MEKFLEWFASSPVASFLRTFAAILVASAVSDFAKVGAIDLSNYQAWIIAALVAAVPVLTRWLNPSDQLGRAG